MNSTDKEIIKEKLIGYGELAEVKMASENIIGAYPGISDGLAAMDAEKNNSSYREIGSSKGGILGRICIFLKKAIRKLIFFYVEPVCIQQSEFNGAATAVIARLSEAVRKLAENDVSLENYARLKARDDARNRAEISNLTERIDRAEKQLGSMAERIVGLNLAGIDTSDPVKESYSQSGEDTIIGYIFDITGRSYADSTYLDLGANHAKKISNTYALYKKGARGVLVEANPALIPELRLYRSDDVIVNKCLDETSGRQVTFYVLSGDGLSTIDKRYVDEVCAENPAISLVKEVNVETVTVGDILAQYFFEAPTVLNIDVEGMEQEILGQIDFESCRPFIIIVEVIPYRNHIVIEEKDGDVREFLEGKGYTEYAFTGINSIFVDKSQLNFHIAGDGAGTDTAASEHIVKVARSETADTLTIDKEA